MMKRILLFSMFLNASPLLAKSKHAAIITRVNGDVRLLTNPAKKVEGEGPHASFNGTFYQEQKAKRGMKLKNGYVIQTTPDSKARLIFKNGDTMTVSPGTSYKISWTKEDSSPVVDLFYGKVRSIFKKNGPRKGTKIKTKTSVMGVRGTDFFVSSRGSTEIAVLRGEVQLNANNKPKSKPVSLQSGFTAKINIPKTKPVETVKADSKPGDKKIETVEEPPAIAIHQTTKSELVIIQKSSTVKKADVGTKVAMNEVEKEQHKEMEALEKKCAEVVMEDIKESDPIMYSQIKDQKDLSLDTINKVTIGKMYKEAPKAKKDEKAFEEDLNTSDEDVYDKYFKID